MEGEERGERIEKRSTLSTFLLCISPSPIETELIFLQNISHVCIGFINRTANEWQCESRVQVLGNTIEGYTEHFTDFAVLIGKVRAPRVNIVDFDGLNKINESTIAACIFSENERRRED